jgi:hypothetical protein
MGNILSPQGYSTDDIDDLLDKKVNTSDLATYAKKIELASYQPKGDYALKTQLASYATSNHNHNADLETYAKKTDLIRDYQPKGDYATLNHNHDTDLKTKTMWCATGDLCEVPANKNVKFGGNVDIDGKLKVGGKLIDDYIAAKTVSEENVASALSSNNTFLTNVQKTLYDNQKTSIVTSLNNADFRTQIVSQLKTDSEYLNKAKGPAGTVSTNTGFEVKGANVINFGSDVAGKEQNAGKIGYGTFDGGASLNIVGAGKPGETRTVKIWDDLVVTKDVQVNGKLSTSFGAYFPGGTKGNPNNWGTHFPYTDGSNYIRGDTYINGDLYVNGRKI